jgi:hypothetical protein
MARGYNEQMIYTSCDYKVPGMILFQADAHIYRLLRRVTFEVLPLSTYAYSPTMLPATVRNIFGIPVLE